MRMASTTVPTSFEHESISTFRLRSICISSFNVSMPFFSGIKTSRMMKSGRSPPLTFESASLPELTVSTSNPSTSSRVCRYFRMLGSSSTTRIFSFVAMNCSLSIKKSSTLPLIHRQQKREPASTSRFTFDPDFSAMRLDKPLRNCQPQSHPRSVPVHSYKIFEYLLMMLRRDSRPGVRHTHFYAVRSRQAKSPSLFRRSHGCHAALPEMRPRTQRHAAAGGRVFQGIVEKIGRRLLHLLVIEPEHRYRRINVDFQFDSLALKRFRPPFRKLLETISQIVLAQLQHQLAALQRRIIQEHRDQAHQPFAAVLRLLQNILLLVRQSSQRSGQQQVVVAFDHREWCLQLMRGGRKEYCFLPVYLLQFQICRQKISICNLPLLQELLNRQLRGRILCLLCFGFALQFHNKPVRLGHPLDLRGGLHPP